MAQARYYQDMLKKLIVAHRGVSSAAQENTIAAFQKAIAVGADMIEFDVRRTKDGVLVIHHDEIAATFGELRAAAAKSGFELATLEETLTSTSGLIQLDVELKETGYESDVLKLLRVLNPSTVCITSFDPTCVRNFKLLDHHMRAGLLVAHGTEEDIAARYSESSADFLAPHYSLLDAAARIADGLFVWRADDDDAITRSLRHPSVAAVITDHVETALKIRDAMR